MTDTLRQRVEKALALAKPLEMAEAKAESLREQIPAAQLFVGLKGFTLPEDHYDIIPGLFSIRRLTNPPGIIHVCRAADSKETDYLGVSRYSGGCHLN